MRVIRTLHARRLTCRLPEQQAFYHRPWTTAEIRHWQLAKLNAQWPSICRHVPYFRRLQQERQLPDHFDNWHAFKRPFPS